jgi:RNA polymerase sigma-70 factor (ECF subfamily)
LLLAYQRGLTHERIAPLIGQPLGTIKSWIRRGLQSLRACLEP